MFGSSISQSRSKKPTVEAKAEKFKAKIALTNLQNQVPTPMMICHVLAVIFKVTSVFGVAALQHHVPRSSGPAPCAYVHLFRQE